MDGKTLTELGFSRGRVALWAILRGLGVGRGDEVVLQAFTCSAVAEGIAATGARPVYVDIEEEGYNLAPESLSERLTPRCRAIVVQHTFGIPARIDPIMRIARDADVPVVEDCCHTLASSYGGRRLGSFGAAAFYSYEWGKPLPVGLGGAAVANREDLRERLAEIVTGLECLGVASRLRLELQYHLFRAIYRPESYWLVRRAFHLLSRMGAAAGNFHSLDVEAEPSSDFRYRLSPQVSRRVIRQFSLLERENRHRCDVARQYRQAISSAALQHPAIPEQGEACLARYPLRAREKDRLIEAARKAHIELSDWYRSPVHPLEGEALRGAEYQRGSCPHAEQRAREIVSLPTHGRVSQRFIERATQLLNAA